MFVIHTLGAPWPPRSIKGRMLVATKGLGGLRRNLVRCPVHAGLGYICATAEVGRSIVPAVQPCRAGRGRH